MTPEVNTRKPRSVRSRGITALVLLSLAACASTADETSAPSSAPTEASQPDLIEIREAGLHPEDVEWDAERSRFLISSITSGSISAVDDAGTTTVLDAGDGVTGTIGLKIDPARGRLLAAGADFGALADPSVPGEARLITYDLESGERTSLIDLGALRPDLRHGANDVAVAEDGTAYVTDALAPVIYAVDVDGNASVLVDDPRLGTPDGLGLNGIEVHPDGYLIVAQFAGDKLFRVSFDPDPDISEITLPEPISGDGLDLDDDGTLVVAAPSTPAIFALTSDDQWASALIKDQVATAQEDSTANTAFRDGSVYAINAHFEEIGAAEPWPTFEILRTELGAP